jgi:hypothetical protein
MSNEDSQRFSGGRGFSSRFTLAFGRIRDLGYPVWSRFDHLGSVGSRPRYSNSFCVVYVNIFLTLTGIFTIAEQHENIVLLFHPVSFSLLIHIFSGVRELSRFLSALGSVPNTGVEVAREVLDDVLSKGSEGSALDKWGRVFTSLGRLVRQAWQRT